jgi:glycosyltransferase involved in cell wall biosynthesis
VFEIMRALHRVLVDKALRDRMKERGYQQAQKFSWEISVRRVMEAYRQMAVDGRSAATQSTAAD